MASIPAKRKERGKKKRRMRGETTAETYLHARESSLTPRCENTFWQHYIGCSVQNH